MWFRFRRGMVLLSGVSSKKKYIASNHPHPPHRQLDRPKNGSTFSSAKAPWKRRPFGSQGGSCSLAGVWAGCRRATTKLRPTFGGILGRIHWWNPLAGNWAGSTGGLFWRDTGRDPLADHFSDHSGGILGGIHWRTTLAGYCAGSTGALWRDTARRDPLAGYWAGSTAGIHWRTPLAGYCDGRTPLTGY